MAKEELKTARIVTDGTLVVSNLSIAELEGIRSLLVEQIGVTARYIFDTVDADAMEAPHLIEDEVDILNGLNKIIRSIDQKLREINGA